MLMFISDIVDTVLQIKSGECERKQLLNYSSLITPSKASS